MNLHILILFLQGVESLREVSGYLGDTVTLPSGADTSWNLSSIDWSIFSNNTLIATYRGRRKNIERVDRYKGRLQLNTSSGDLTIHGLTAEDAMEYAVDLINTKGQNSGNKTKLTVTQRLLKPTIHTVDSGPEKGGCWFLLRCSTTDKNANLSWQGQTPVVTVFDANNPDGNSVVFLAILNATQDPAEITCTSSRNMKEASTAVTPTCDDNELQRQSKHPTGRERSAVFFFLGGMVGGTLTTLIYLLRRKLFSPKDNNIVV